MFKPRFFVFAAVLAVLVLGALQFTGAALATYHTASATYVARTLDAEQAWFDRSDDRCLDSRCVNPNEW